MRFNVKFSLAFLIFAFLKFGLMAVVIALCWHSIAAPILFVAVTLDTLGGYYLGRHSAERQQKVIDEMTASLRRVDETCSDVLSRVPVPLTLYDRAIHLEPGENVIVLPHHDYVLETRGWQCFADGRFTISRLELRSSLVSSKSDPAGTFPDVPA